VAAASPKRQRAKKSRYSERDRTPIHNRMPVILLREAWSAWLGEEPASNGHDR
jgi:putative SOS response-associated peptidase YedK